MSFQYDPAVTREITMYPDYRYSQDILIVFVKDRDFEHVLRQTIHDKL